MDFVAIRCDLEARVPRHEEHAMLNSRIHQVSDDPEAVGFESVATLSEAVADELVRRGVTFAEERDSRASSASDERAASDGDGSIAPRAQPHARGAQRQRPLAATTTARLTPRSDPTLLKRLDFDQESDGTPMRRWWPESGRPAARA
jgi:hypothetical protein